MKLEMYKIIAISITLVILLGACSNNAGLPEVPQGAEAEAPAAGEVTQVTVAEPAVVVEEPTNDFPQTLGYTQQPPTIDPAKGYFVEEIADGIYWLYGSFYQAMFLTTGEGVIVVDAPQPIGASYLAAIREVTDEPITHLIYSHSHGDHIGAAGLFPPDIEYIAHQDTVNFLSGVPAPTITYEDSYTLEVGNQVLELSYIGTFHSMGDTVVYAPRQKVLLVADLFHPGSAPFAGFGATIDMDTYLQAHDVLLGEYDFNVLIAGHTQILGTKAHLETNKAFALSLQEIVRTAMASGPSNTVVQTCVAMAIEQWSGILANVPDRVEASCRAMEQYVLTSSPPSGLAPLPQRSGPRTQTTGSVPHVQLDVDAVQAVNEELYRRAFALPDVVERPTIASLPGADGMWLGPEAPVARPETIVAGREFAHIHPDGSLHAPLPYERALEAVEKGWAERHPWADQRDGWEGFVMLFTPQTMAELDVTFQLIVESYNHVTGRTVQASDFMN